MSQARRRAQQVQTRRSLPDPPDLSGPPALPARPARSLTRTRRRRPHGRILDSELLEIGLVLGRVVVVLLHLRSVLRHRLLVEPDGRLVVGSDERRVLRVLRLDVVEVLPRLRDEL